MEGLRDIRTLEEIPDISLYLFIMMVLFALLLVAGIIIMIVRYMKSKKEDLTRKEVYERLENIDFQDAKKAAYKITKYARYLINDERSQKMFDALEPKLTKYKYIKNPPAIDEDTIGQYNLFLEVVDG